MLLLLEQMNRKMTKKFWLNIVMLIVMLSLAILIVELS